MWVSVNKYQYYTKTPLIEHCLFQAQAKPKASSSKGRGRPRKNPPSVKESAGDTSAETKSDSEEQVVALLSEAMYERLIWIWSVMVQEFYLFI